MPTYYSSTPPDLVNYGTGPADLAPGYVAPPVVLSARRPTPTPVVKPKTTTVGGVPITTPNPGALNPAPQAGQGPYGKVPGPIEYPTTPYAEATRIYPGMTSLTPQAMEEIRSQIAGEFTPAEENALWDVSNRFGVQSGMPGAGLWSNRFMDNRVDAGMKRRQQGVENYGQILNILSKLGVDPNLAAEIAGRNATMGAAPDPEAAAKALEAAYRNSMANPAAGTGNPLGGNMYGRGFTSPGFSPWPQGGTRTPTTYPGQGELPQPNPNAVPEMSSRTEDDVINAWLDYIDPVAAGLISSGGQAPVDDTWFDPGYTNEEVGTQDWWYDPSYDDFGNQVGQSDDTWFDPGYGNDEMANDDWWFYE